MEPAKLEHHALTDNEGATDVTPPCCAVYRGNLKIYLNFGMYENYPHSSLTLAAVFQIAPQKCRHEKNENMKKREVYEECYKADQLWLTNGLER